MILHHQRDGSVKSKEKVGKTKAPSKPPRGEAYSERDGKKKETRLTKPDTSVREPCDYKNDECWDLEDELCEVVESVLPDNEVVLTIRVLDEGTRDFVLVAECLEA